MDSKVKKFEENCKRKEKTRKDVEDNIVKVVEELKKTFQEMHK